MQMVFASGVSRLASGNITALSYLLGVVCPGCLVSASGYTVKFLAYLYCVRASDNGAAAAAAISNCLQDASQAAAAAACDLLVLEYAWVLCGPLQCTC